MSKKLTKEKLLDKLIEEGEKWPLHTIIARIFWDEATPLLWQIKEQLQQKTVTREWIASRITEHVKPGTNQLEEDYKTTIYVWCAVVEGILIKVGVEVVDG